MPVAAGRSVFISLVCIANSLRTSTVNCCSSNYLAAFSLHVISLKYLTLSHLHTQCHFLEDKFEGVWKAMHQLGLERKLLQKKISF